MAVHTACQTRAKAKTARDHFWKRQGIKSVLWIMLPAVLVLGYFFPVLGFSILACMGASIGISFKHGRAWCDFCPRGTFFDAVMSKVSRGKPVPRLLRSTPWRIFMLIFLMGMMTFQLTQVWGDAAAVGKVFWNLLLVTTIVGVVLAIPYRGRTWCAFCPMGSAASWIGKGKKPLLVDAEKCNACGLCAKVCPMELYPGGEVESGALTHGDCLKCSQCVVSCARNALCLGAEDQRKSA